MPDISYIVECVDIDDMANASVIVNIWVLSRVLYETFGDSRMYSFGRYYRLIIEDDSMIFNDTKQLGQMSIKVASNILTVQFAGAKLAVDTVHKLINEYILLLSADNEKVNHYRFLDLHPDRKLVIRDIVQSMLLEHPEFIPDQPIIEQIIINTLASMAK